MRTHRRILTLFTFFALVFALTVPSAYAKSCPQCGKGTLITMEQDQPTCMNGGSKYVYCDSCQYSYTVDLAPLGHDFKTTNTATCTSPGVKTGTCTRCGLVRTEKVAALGHSYKETVEEPTCTEDGATTSTCVRCGRHSTTVLPALGHDYVTEETAPTCTEDGSRVETCTVCGDEQTEVIPATGHSYTEERTEAGCTEDGSITATCTVCGDTITEVIPATGHSFGEWTEIEAPTLSKTGCEERSCSACGATESNELPQKTLTESPGVIAAIAAASLAVIAVAAVIIKKATAAAAVAGSTAAAGGTSLGMINLPMKTILLYTQDTEANRAFREKLSKKSHLDIKVAPYGQAEELTKLAAEGKPDLIIVSVSAIPELEQTITVVSAAYKDADFAAIDETGLNGAVLTAMQEQGKLMGSAAAGDKDDRKLAKLILPLYKPDKSAADWADNATMITDALGLPVISGLLSAFVLGADVVEVVKKRGLDVADTADIVGDVATLLGLDTLASIAVKLRNAADSRERKQDKKKLKKLKKQQ